MRDREKDRNRVWDPRTPPCPQASGPGLRLPDGDPLAGDRAWLIVLETRAKHKGFITDG
ncbi:hypothetical protein GCM10010430_58360 [Kitasatospora cystarginea]|uniref:Uncharacterized protein n=1 Tax=Kitasatospora cystarginea TaxID=58350 RepID=A0ABP5RL04_9ACTN